MPVFKPSYRFYRISDIPLGFLKERGIRGLVLDIDNTLTTHDNPKPAAGVTDWLNAARDAGMSMVILSNNKPGRVKPFADILGLEFEADGKKPLPAGVWRACRHMGLPPSKTALIGDQIFTDILGGNLAGLLTLLVEPIEPESGWFFKLKRRGERLILGPALTEKEM